MQRLRCVPWLGTLLRAPCKSMPEHATTTVRLLTNSPVGYEVCVRPYTTVLTRAMHIARWQQATRCSQWHKRSSKELILVLASAALSAGCGAQLCGCSEQADSPESEPLGRTSSLVSLFQSGTSALKGEVLRDEEGTPVVPWTYFATWVRHRGVRCSPKLTSSGCCGSWGLG